MYRSNYLSPKVKRSCWEVFCKYRDVRGNIVIVHVKDREIGER